MKAYFDKKGNLVIEPENNTERVALHLWTYTNADSDQTIRELLDNKSFGLRTCFGDYGDANSNVAIFIRSKSE